MSSYLIYELDTGKIREKRVVPFLFAQDIPQGCWAKEADCDILTHKMDVSLVPFDPPIVALPPEPEPAVRESEINAVRNRLEQAPISGFDFDTQSEVRMRDAIEQWDYVPDTKIGDRIAWKAADNQIHLLTLNELTTLFAQLKWERAARASRLHAHARNLANQLPDLDRAALNVENWPC